MVEHQCLPVLVTPKVKKCLMFTVCKVKDNHAGDLNIPINKIKQITLILSTPFLSDYQETIKVNYSNKGQEFPEITKVFLTPVACGKTMGSVKRPDPNCQLS